MIKSSIVILSSILVLAGIGIGLYFLIRKKHSSNNSNDLTTGDNSPICSEDGSNTINPAVFEVGMISEKRHRNANVCSNKPGPSYSIQQPYVDYGDKKQRLSSNCLCTEFISPP